MARKGWDSLSPGYKARLEKNGISKTGYESGASIRAARGHKTTPERPTQAANFPTYQNERTNLVRRLTARKQAFFGISPKWNPKRAAEKFRKVPPPMAKLRQWVNFSREDWLDAIREDSDTASYLGYH